VHVVSRTAMLPPLVVEDNAEGQISHNNRKVPCLQLCAHLVVRPTARKNIRSRDTFQRSGQTLVKLCPLRINLRILLETE
jgi:hypothetical protein